MVYATTSDLQRFEPNIMDNGLVEFDVELEQASEDLLDMLKTDWWQSVGSSGTFDATRLNVSKLVNATVFIALYAYILPKLSSRRDVDGDAFTRKAEHFEAMFKREWSMIGKRTIYDFDNDGAFNASDAARPARRFVRA